MKCIILPDVRQTFNFDCGAKALESIFTYYGLNIREDNIMKLAKTSPNGTSIKNLINTIKKYGLKSVSKQMDIEDIKNYINKKIPVIVILQAWAKKKEVCWENDWKDGHYVIAIGYTKDKILFEDPSTYERTYLKYNELEERWHDIDKNGKKYFHQAIAIYGKKPNFKRDKIIHMD